MSFFTVDQGKCNKCGICVEVCPTGVIEFKDQNSFPTQTASTNKVCINCGHCLSACPQDAFLLADMPLESCPAVRGEFFLSAEGAEHFLRARRSIRAFKDKAVDREILAKLVDIARYAPSSRNTQPVNWVMVYERDEVKRMSEMVIKGLRFFVKKDPMQPAAPLYKMMIADYESGKDTICYNAPHLILVHAEKDNMDRLTNCVIALSYLDLALTAFGLGGCWAGYFNSVAAHWPPLQNALGFPRDHTSYGAILVGYPKYKYNRLPLRNEPSVIWR